MDKVYAVSEGAYSDYRIVAVFDNKEEAEKFRVNHLGGGNYAYVEDWPLNTKMEDAFCWQVRVNKEGTVTYSSRELRSGDERPGKYRGRDGLEFQGYGKTEEHGRRQAEDLRREYLASR